MATRESQTVSKLELQNPVIAPSPGSRTVVGGRAITNAMLLSIPDEEFKLLRPHLEFVELAFHQSLYEPRKRISRRTISRRPSYEVRIARFSRSPGA
jgi:hypothetical protein